MTFEEAEQRFAVLRQLYADGRMSREHYASAVYELQVVGPDGAYWQIDPGTGGWLRWNGSAWVPADRTTSQAIPPQPGPATPRQDERLQPKKPSGGSRAGKITAFIIGRIILAAISYGIAWVLHTWLLVYVNDGYNLDTGISPWINVSGNSSTAFTIWFFGFGFVWSFLVAFFTAGPVRAFQTLFAAPGRLVTVLRNGFPLGLASLVIGMGLTLIITGGMELESNARLTAGIIWFFLGAGYPGLVLANGIRRFLNMFKPNKTTPSIFDMDTTHALVMGISVGFLIGIPFGGASLILGWLFLIGGVVIMFMFGLGRVRIPQVAMFLLTGIFIAGVFALIDLLMPKHAHADDGGWKEFKSSNPDGTLADWLQDSASQTAMEHSRAPATGAGISSFFPSLTGRNLPSGIMDAIRQGGRRLIDLIRLGGSLPEVPSVGPGFGVAAAAGSSPPPTYKEITERLHKAIESFSGKESEPVEWPNIKKYTGKGRWTRAILIGLIAASLPYAAGLSAVWILGTGAAAALADKYGPDATEITEMMAGSSDD